MDILAKGHPKDYEWWENTSIHFMHTCLEYKLEKSKLEEILRRGSNVTTL